jgi:hypothetical protein
MGILVSVSIQEMAFTYHVIFLDPRSHKTLAIFRYSSAEPVYEILRRGHANLETINIVEMNLAQRRPVMVDLKLTDEQYNTLRQRCSGKPT